MGTGRFEFPAESGVRTPGRRRQTRRCGASEKHADGHATTRCCARESESDGTAANDYFRSRSLGESSRLYWCGISTYTRIGSSADCTAADGEKKQTLVCIPQSAFSSTASTSLTAASPLPPLVVRFLLNHPPRVARKDDINSAPALCRHPHEATPRHALRAALGAP